MFELPARMIVVADNEEEARRYMERSPSWKVPLSMESELVATRDVEPDDLPGVVRMWEWPRDE